MDQTFILIKSFIERKRWKYDFQLNYETRLESDLKIYGDDAVEFLIEFGKEFKVDVSKFMAADYFEGEGIDYIGSILDMFRKVKSKREKKILKIKHLVRAVEMGKLDEEVISATL